MQDPSRIKEVLVVVDDVNVQGNPWPVVTGRDRIGGFYSADIRQMNNVPRLPNPGEHWWFTRAYGGRWTIGNRHYLDDDIDRENWEAGKAFGDVSISHPGDVADAGTSSFPAPLDHVHGREDAEEIIDLEIPGILIVPNLISRDGDIDYDSDLNPEHSISPAAPALANWHVRSDTGALAVEATGHSSSPCLRIINTDIGNANIVEVESDSFELEEPWFYEASAWFRFADAFTGAGSTRVKWCIEWLDDDDNVEGTVDIGPYLGLLSGWRRHYLKERPATTETSRARMVVLVHFRSDGIEDDDVFMDDVHFQRTSGIQADRAEIRGLQMVKRPFRTLPWSDSRDHRDVWADTSSGVETGDWVDVFQAGSLSLDSDAVYVNFQAGVSPGADTVIISVIAVNAGSNSHLTIWKAGTSMPPTSNVEVLADAYATNNFAVVDVGRSGGDRNEISIYNNEDDTDIVVDIFGFFINGRYQSITPQRIIDTRIDLGYTDPWHNAETRNVSVAGPFVPSIPGYDIDTAGEVRLIEKVSGAVSEVFVINSESPRVCQYYWEHGLDPISSDADNGQDRQFAIQARLTDGTGAIRVYAPDSGLVLINTDDPDLSFIASPNGAVFESFI